jgi:hypothetical protein
MAVRLTKHLFSMIGAVLALAGVLSLLASESVKSWAKSHGYLIFIIMIIVLAVAFAVTSVVRPKSAEPGSQPP